MEKKESMASRVRKLLAKNPYITAAEASKKVGCTLRYADWVIWYEGRKSERREWENDRRRERYYTDPDYREQILEGVRARRKRANEKRGAA